MDLAHFFFEILEVSDIAVKQIEAIRLGQKKLTMHLFWDQLYTWVGWEYLGWLNVIYNLLKAFIEYAYINLRVKDQQVSIGRGEQGVCRKRDYRKSRM